jgi:hypothetical protein
LGIQHLYPLCHCWDDVRGVGEVGKLSLPSPLLHLRWPSRLTTEVTRFKASGRPCTPLYPFAPSTILSLPSSLCLIKERGVERGERKKEGNRKKYQHLKGVAFPSSLSHGKVLPHKLNRSKKPLIKTTETRFLV